MAEAAGLGGSPTVVDVPAQSGRAIVVRHGALVQVIDVGSHQVGDMWVIDAADPRRWLSVSRDRGPLPANATASHPGSDTCP